MKAVQLVIASNGVHYLEMRSLGLHSISGMEKEGKDRHIIAEIVMSIHFTQLETQELTINHSSSS
jgi:hypothetical protein